MEIFQDGELEEEMRKRDYQANNLSAIWQLFASSYNDAIESLTCPVRASYSVADLGPRAFSVSRPPQANDANNMVAVAPLLDVVREDLQLRNPRGEALQCSFWHAAAASTTTTTTTSSPPPVATSPPAPCIVYLHGMSSSRKECVYLRDRVLALGFSLLAMDFSGSGLSEGERMSFGHFEKDDLRTVVDYLFATNRASRVGLWGRCVGGAAALLYLCESLEYEYKTLRLSLRDARALQLGQCKQTGAILCVRPGRVFRFRMTQPSASNGDFAVLSIGGHLVKGLDLEACRALLISDSRCNDQVVEIRGYVRRDAAAFAVEQPESVPPLVFALALDSTYGDMERVIADMLTEVAKSAEKRNVSVPLAMVTAASKILSRSVRKTAGFQFHDIAVVEAVHALDVPCQFVSASKVDFIRPDHTRAVFDAYGGDKHWLAFDGVHDQNRPDHVAIAVCRHFDFRWRESI